MLRQIGVGLGLAALLTGCSRVPRDKYEADLLAACQDNYTRQFTLADKARSALAETQTSEADKHLRQWLSETRRFSVCYRHPNFNKQIADVEQGLRSGDLVAPPPPVGVE